jgi:hypothetical protein
MKLWSWLKRNVRALEALVAVVAIITAVVASWPYLQNATKRDLLLEVQRNESTIPFDLMKWSKDVAFALELLPKQLADEPLFLDRLRPLATSDTAKRLPFLNSSQGLALLTLTVKNQANHTVSGTRLYVTDLQGRLWDVYAWGSFLTEEEAKVFAQQVKSASGIGNSNLVLPELPPLPPQNLLIIYLLGSFTKSSQATITVPADNFAVVDLVTVQRSWLIDMYLNPRKIFFPAMLLLLFFIVLGYSTVRKTKQRIMYDAACHEALEGHYGAAMHLLEKAFEAGYSDREYVKCDPTLEPLRAREDFNKLIGDPPESTP